MKYDEMYGKKERLVSYQKVDGREKVDGEHDLPSPLPRNTSAQDFSFCPPATGTGHNCNPSRRQFCGNAVGLSPASLSFLMKG